jgi:crotonobetainyl-CoA:carnitine CoA-transferase CaiB-like acyl-CoA transferase
MASLTAPKGAEPFPIRTGMGDHTCALATLSAILAAVIDRTRTGKGRLVESSLLRAGAYAISSDMAIQLRLGRVASTRARARVVNPLANFFQASDGRWLCILPRDGGSDWAAIAAAAGRPDMAADPRFASARERRANSAELVAMLDQAFAEMTLDEAGERLDGADVVWAPVQTPAQLIADPQAEAAGCFVDIPSQVGPGQVGEASRAPAGPVRFPGADDGPKGPAPMLGQHTRAILREIGYSAVEVDALFAAGAAA